MIGGVHWVCTVIAMVLIAPGAIFDHRTDDIRARDNVPHSTLSMTLCLSLLDCYGAPFAASAVSATRISGCVGRAFVRCSRFKEWRYGGSMILNSRLLL
jgi:hypothetical protein